MAKRNEFDGYCSVCGEAVRADDGFVIPDPDARRGYLILCVEHAPEASTAPPSPPEASKLPSIHRGEEKYER
jgi:hypothetical protein